MSEQEYNSEIEYIFNRFPSYQKVGKVAYKPGIESMMELDALLGSPHKSFKTIHVAGTNGKGTVSHMMAASLWGIKKESKIGLYTSPHLLDFRERIKVNGEMVSKEFVYDFITRYKANFESIGCSFFEITTAMAFAYFASCGVEYAVIECGLGGRLDSTNIITPQLSIITNIGLDHCDHLGHTYKEVASEKAGIIKSNIPIVVGCMGGETDAKEYVGDIFIEKAAEVGADLYYVEDGAEFGFNKIDRGDNVLNPDKYCSISSTVNTIYTLAERDKFDLKGDAPQKNFKTVSLALGVLLEREGGVSSVVPILDNIYNCAKLTGLRGRWECLSSAPEVRCDTGHNAHGFKIIGGQLSKIIESGRRLIIVMGVVADKDLGSIIPLLPKDAYYYFVNAAGSRALPAEELREKMVGAGFTGEAATDVVTGVKLALDRANREDFVFIGGSTFVVAEALCYNY